MRAVESVPVESGRPARASSPAWYAEAWRQQLAPAQTALLRRAAIRPGERVLEVGSGSGLVTFAAAAAAGRSGAALGTDAAQSYVDRAEARARACGLANVRFQRMDAAHLVVPSHSFDVALCALGLMQTPAPGLALSEMARAVVPGGRVVIAVWGSRSERGWAEVFPIVNAHARLDVCPQFEALGTAERLSALLHEAGLTGIVSERLETRLEWLSSDDALGATLAGDPLAAAYTQFDACTRRAVDRAYLDALKPWRIGDAYSIPAEFLIVSGHR